MPEDDGKVMSTALHAAIANRSLNCHGAIVAQGMQVSAQIRILLSGHLVEGRVHLLTA
jgi:hypothetical protein